MNIIQPNSQVSSEWVCVCVCVCSLALFLLLYKRYYEETSFNLNTNLTENSPFFISYKRDENLDHLTFKCHGEL